MSQQPNDLRDEVWNYLLTADYNARYFGSLHIRYYKRQKWAEIFLAVIASSSVAAWGIWRDVTLLWQLLSAVSTLIAVALPILNMKKSIGDLAELESKWTQVHSDYKLLWFDLEHTDISRERIIDIVKKLVRKETDLAKRTISIADDERLLEKIRQQVIESNTGSGR